MQGFKTDLLAKSSEAIANTNYLEKLQITNSARLIEKQSIHAAPMSLEIETTFDISNGPELEAEFCLFSHAMAIINVRTS